MNTQNETLVLQATGLARKYPRKAGESNYFYAVKPLDLSIHRGTLTEVTGRSGSGKTTLLHMLAGLLQPSEGRVAYLGQDLYAMDDAARSALRCESFGVIPQIHSGLEHLTVQENILLPWSISGGHPKDPQAEAMYERAHLLMNTFGIASLAEAHPDELSGGELRRLAIARAMLLHPAVIFADEPTGDLDDENTRQVLQHLREIADGGAAVIMVTHETAAAEYADRVYRMDGGEWMR